MKVGIQLYSVRQNMARDPLGTMRRVAQMGYHSLETANHFADRDPVIGFSLSADEVLQGLAGTGARIVSGHISPLDPDDADAARRVLEQQAAMGLRYVATNPHDFSSREATLGVAAFLNRLGAIAAEFGIQLLYHNHFAEFRREGDETVYDILMANTDPALLGIELDTYWAMRAGQDPIALLRGYGSRVRILHQKDYPAGYEGQMNMLPGYEQSLAAALAGGEGNEGLSVRQRDEKAVQLLLAGLDRATFVEIGTGVMNIQGIIDAANTYCGCDYIILEQDFTAMDEFDSIRLSMENFKKYQGIDFAP